MKVAIYARVSSKDQHCDMQLREIRERCQREGWEVAAIAAPAAWKVHAYAKPPKQKDGKEPPDRCTVCGCGTYHAMHTRRFGEYVDTLTGTSASRPELDRLMNDAREHRFDAVLVWKLDRFGRSVRNFTEHLMQLDSWNIRFVATTQNIDTDKANPMSRLLMHILAAFAEFEHDLIVERVTSGMAAAKHKGIRCGRPKKVIDRDRLRAMRKQGGSLREIARKMNVSYATVARVLAEPAPAAKVRARR